MSENPLDTPRGIANGCMMSAVIWIVIYVAAKIIMAVVQ